MAVTQFTRLSQGVDQFGNPIVGAFPQSNCINAMVFGGAGSKTQSLPQDVNGNYPRHVLIQGSQNLDVWMLWGAACAVPGVDKSDGSSPEIVNPTNGLRQIPPGTTQISVAVGAAGLVSQAYYY